jgi:hypothetical protein
MHTMEPLLQIRLHFLGITISNIQILPKQIIIMITLVQVAHLRLQLYFLLWCKTTFLVIQLQASATLSGLELSGTKIMDGQITHLTCGTTRDPLNILIKIVLQTNSLMQYQAH